MIKIQVGMSYILNQERMRITSEGFSLGPSSQNVSSIFGSGLWVRAYSVLRDPVWPCEWEGTVDRRLGEQMGDWEWWSFLIPGVKSSLPSARTVGVAYTLQANETFMGFEPSWKEGWIWGCTGDPEWGGRAAPPLGTGKLLSEGRTWSSLTSGVQMMPCWHVLDRIE